MRRGRGGRLTADERTLTYRDRTIGFLGAMSSSFTLAWLATHRDRLRSFILGGPRLTVLVVWDTRGARPVDHSDVEVDALAVIVYGPQPARDGDGEATALAKRIVALGAEEPTDDRPETVIHDDIAAAAAALAGRVLRR